MRLSFATRTDQPAEPGVRLPTLGTDPGCSTDDTSWGGRCLTEPAFGGRRCLTTLRGDKLSEWMILHPLHGVRIAQKSP
jgi:hypothetical protein